MALLITRPSTYLPLLINMENDDHRYDQTSVAAIDDSKGYYQSTFPADIALAEGLLTRCPTLESMKSQNVDDVSRFLNQNLPVSYSPSFLMQFIVGKDCFCYFARDLSRASRTKPDDSAIVGVVAGKILRSALNRDVCTGNVMILAVASEWRRFGVGWELLRKLELAFHQVASSSITSLKSIFLHVASTNTGAIRFYEKGGYAYEKSESGYYGRRADGIVMRKHLES
ncbi:acyl-CoA N-acyltransferase [Lipomyces kononenkoae]|uniref:Acyl-CoA N-acyltransferase n=1 Tax=Lipomyces kononenkoae TaxID=34357 RepID=A0ACC3SYZ0_LIPKO